MRVIILIFVHLCLSVVKNLTNDYNRQFDEITHYARDATGHDINSILRKLTAKDINPSIPESQANGSPAIFSNYR